MSDEALNSPEARQSRIETKLDGLIQAMGQFRDDTERRFGIVENQQRLSGRWSWSAVGVIITGMALVGTAIGAVMAARIGPLEGAIAGLITNQQRTEDDRHRDNADLDTRLQREMRLVSDVVAQQAAATSEMLKRDEQRINDVTYRQDKGRDDERQELITLRDALLKKALDK